MCYITYSKNTRLFQSDYDFGDDNCIACFLLQILVVALCENWLGHGSHKSLLSQSMNLEF